MSDALQQLLDERDAGGVVIDLFTATDRRDWAKVEECLAPRLTLDMTSVAGGEPVQTTGAEVAAMWKEGLAPIDHVHHQNGAVDTNQIEKRFVLPDRRCHVPEASACVHPYSGGGRAVATSRATRGRWPM